MDERTSPHEQELDDLLRAALLRANSPAVMGLGEEEPHFSPAFERKMDRLLADPFRRAKKALRPLWARALSSAAAILLVSAVTLSALMVNPTARAWVERVITEWSEVATRFIFQGAAERIAVGWTAEYLPEGFVLTEETELFEHSLFYQYESADGGVIRFDCFPIGSGMVTSIDSEHSDPEPLTIQGGPATLHRSNTPGKPNYLTWTDVGETTWFCLTSELAPEELIKIAESVTALP